MIKEVALNFKEEEKEAEEKRGRRDYGKHRAGVDKTRVSRSGLAVENPPNKEKCSLVAKPQSAT